MFQGTGSDVGKSLIVAGLCRAFSRRGLRVRPFKPQNMSNNAAATPDGGEIGRAQALQARAAGVPPTVDMNPVLLKPQSEQGAQLIVGGQKVGSFSARDYARHKPDLLGAVCAAFERLAREADLVLVEGAGSPAEINLRAGDIANMGFAEAADLPVILIGDIERGGVIASLVGTHAVLQAAEAARVKGFIVNKFRGDASLFDEGLQAIAERTGWAALGVVPAVDELRFLPAEDSMSLSGAKLLHSVASVAPSVADDATAVAPLKIAVPRLPRIANFDDLDPLLAEPGVAVMLVPPGEPLPADAALILLPGSKSTIADLKFLRAQGWEIDLLAHHRRGGQVLGICGGFQMLGESIADPDGVEGAPQTVAGLGLLPMQTIITPNKLVGETDGHAAGSGAAVRGYEIHCGRSTGPALARPMLTLGGRADGAVAADGRVMGCYLHGLFSADDFRREFLAQLGGRGDGALHYDARIEEILDRWADHLERHLALDAIAALAGIGTPSL